MATPRDSGAPRYQRGGPGPGRVRRRRGPGALHRRRLQCGRRPGHRPIRTAPERSHDAVRNAGFRGLVSLDASGNPDIAALETFDDGDGAKLYATGDFDGDNNPELRNIAAWDGVDWTPLDRGLFSAQGKALAVFDDGTGDALYVGGRFRGQLNGVARWDGVAFSALDGGGGPGVTAPADPVALALAVFDDGGGDALYVGGAFTEAGGVAAAGLARWSLSDGWTAVGGFTPTGGASVTVRSLAVFDDGTGPALYVGGDFTEVNGVPAGGAVRWDGTAFQALGGPRGPGVAFSGGDLRVNVLRAGDAGDGEKLFVGGLFDSAGGRAAHGVATWDGQAWSPLIGDAPPTFAAPEVKALTFFDGGVYLGGSFTNLGSEGSSNLGFYRDQPGLFDDDFESGDVSAWSAAFP
ncbi:MAG: hypothetical protein AAGF23_23600 [Acidobacteriota bacterium]